MTGTVAAQNKYMGADKCKMCHKKPSQGEQYKIWKNSAHARAYETLGTAKAKKYAVERGIDDPQKSDKCLKCHVTAYNVDKKYLGKKYKKTDGVACESCHGAGEKYYKKKTMKKLFAKKIKPESVGLTIPDEKVCLRCHNNESPGFKGFDYKKYYEKIKHPIPDKKKK
ncbi:MAG: cytochrome C554 [Calditrichaeota bacterium]|nr:MAG: cytochrome C554 [Calditrichota bacterium]